MRYSLLLCMENKPTSPLKFSTDKASWIVGVILLLHFTVFSQIPQDIPNRSKPTDFTDPLNIVLYIVLPVVMVAAYLYWRKRRNNQ